MESLHDTAAACFMEDLFDFVKDIAEDDDDEEHRNKNKQSTEAIPSLNANGFEPSTFSVSGTEEPLPPEFVEEELEWLSNENAFPTVESYFSILPHNSDDLPKQHSPVSVLENSTTSSNSNIAFINNGSSSTIMSRCRSLHVPVKARSKVRRRLRQELKEKNIFWWNNENLKKIKPTMKMVKTGRQCLHCGSEKTPQWRAGPHGPKTLCNACGVRFKSGRLVPEYRPANSPTFSSKMHSNSHRKVLEMRRQKQMVGLMLVKPMDKG